MNKYISLIDDWMERKERVIQNSRKRNINLMSKFQCLQTEVINLNETRYQELLVNYEEILRKYHEIQLIESTDFNCLRYFKITEPTHSYLLGDLLSHNSSHGQGKLFLNIFLEMLEIPDFEEGRWSVEIEKQNTDIILSRREKENIVIIENKCNNAKDQPNQIYRYWYYQIYRKYKSQFPKENLPNRLPQKFKIVYLISNNWKRPEANSLKKPDWLLDESAPERMPEEWITLWRYDLYINRLVENALNRLNKKNHRLRQYLIQYRDIIKHLN